VPDEITPEIFPVGDAPVHVYVVLGSLDSDTNSSIEVPEHMVCSNTVLITVHWGEYKFLRIDISPAAIRNFETQNIRIRRIKTNFG
jgi:hypothetical protein